MAYTVYGPGFRDPVVLERLFRDRVVEHATPAEAVQPLAGHPHEGEAGGQGSARPYNTQAKLAKQRYQQTGQEPPHTLSPALHARQIMTAPVVSLPADASIRQAWTVFRERRFRHLPVADAQGRVVGIVSDRDMLRYAATHGRVPPYAADAPEASLPLAGLCKTRVLTATPDSEIRHIARVLFEQHIGAMPIVDDEGVLCGIITRSDILHTLVHHIPMEMWV